MDPIHLTTRRLFHNDDNSSDDKHVCPAEDTAGPTIVPFISNLTYHQFATILSGACAIASCLIILIVILLHAFNYSSLVQQRQIIRIVLLVPWVALFSFLIVWQDGAGEYLMESLDFGCAIAISAFLLLLCDYVLAHPTGFDDLFGAGSLQRGQLEGNSPAWLKRCWYGVLQFIPTSIIIWIATCISLAVGTYCAQSNSVHFAHIWITVLKILVTTVAVVSTFRFYGQMKQKLVPHKVFLKFFAFKGIIGLNVLQTLIFNILSGNDTLKPSKYLTYHDIKALPSLILACEMPLFAILLVVAFPVSPYKGAPKAAGPLTAVVDAFNITDLLSAFVRGPMRLVRGQLRLIMRQDSMALKSGPSGYDPSTELVDRRVHDTRYDPGV